MNNIEDRNNIEDIFNETNEFISDNPEDVIESPILVIDLEEVNNEAKAMATLITERLSNYYFDEKYLENHPYVPTKIMTEMENIRRLLKMLSVNEKAQDSLIANITFNAGKGSLYASLTSLQNSMLNIQSQLNSLTTSLENIFKEMQEECDKTFQEKDKEENENGIVGVRGSKEFIKMLQQRFQNIKSTEESDKKII
jgi:hypothetical protein